MKFFKPSLANAETVTESIAIGRAVLQLATPAIAQLLLQALVFLADRAMLGHYSSTALASMRISGPLHWCLYSTVSAFSVGTIALVGRAVGAQDKSLSNATLRASLLLALGTGLAIALGSILGLNPLLAHLPFGSPEVQQAAQDYLQIIFLGMPLQLLSIVAAAALQASGNTQIPLFVGLVANGVNIFLNYCLIFGNWGAPHLGIAGAAIASVTAMAINTVILGIILYQGTRRLTLRDRGGELQALRRLFRVSVPTFNERLFRSLGYLGFSAAIATLGTEAMAAYEITLGIEEICYYIAEGFGIATAAIVAQQLGANRADQATSSSIIATGLAVCCLSLGSLLFLAIPEVLLGIFSKDTQIIAAAVPCLSVAAVAQPFMAMSMAIEQALRGAGNTKTAFYVSAIGWFGVRLLATYIFAFMLNWGLVGVWIGSTCDWMIRAMILAIVFWRGNWREVTV
ncbi:MATE family efflux transporter [Laspinema olomoucense]|uniref:MATE family efflux transporter n=1 Tax=Laspinema olomoucense TaxID=3231600 RepID=UPI0021BBA78C|nr:MATE family efflux transporter [Laspinema sp. D3a]MCT7989977.1 MATE family efflux transporter [Laspinema sp. D3a]